MSAPVIFSLVVKHEGRNLITTLAESDKDGVPLTRGFSQIFRGEIGNEEIIARRIGATICNRLPRGKAFGLYIQPGDQSSRHMGLMVNMLLNLYSGST